MKILVAMSGGIDSSVVAHLLKSQGHELIGVRFTLWTDPLAPAIAEILPSKCCNAQTTARAAQVARDLDIPLHILDLEAEFKREVVDPFLTGYAEGDSPNPCIHCNRTIKFGRLIELANELGCEKLATGHYARVVDNQLFQALDVKKDQSYYLYGLAPHQLERVLFPLGDMKKHDVFRLAEKYKIPYDDVSYRESQDLCFFPEKTPQEFLKRHLADVLQPGEIMKRDGTVVGKHLGVPLYTVGQRRFGVGGSRIPLEIVEKDITHHRLIVAEKGQERWHGVTLKNLHWVNPLTESVGSLRVECLLRSLAPRVSGVVEFSGATGTLQFDEPQPPQAVGQSAVFVQGEQVLGGGVMTGKVTL